MKRIIGLALVAAALVAGCGDTADKNEYVTKVNNAQAALTTSMAKINPAGNPDSIASELDEGAKAIDKTATDFKAIEPPDDAKGAHEKMVKGLSSLAQTFRDAAEAAKQVGPDDLLTLIYTSGTTGPPKGVELTHDNLVKSIEGFKQLIDFPPGGKVISWLPNAHVAERNAHHYIPVCLGLEITICDDPRQIGIGNPTGSQVNARDASRAVSRNRAAGLSDPVEFPRVRRFQSGGSQPQTGNSTVQRRPYALVSRPTSFFNSLAFPTIRQRRVAVEDNLAGGQRGFQLFVPLFRNHRVIEAQRPEIRHCLKRCDAGVGDVCSIEPQFPQVWKLLQKFESLVVNRSVVEIETGEFFERRDGRGAGGACAGTK